jgi:hypothetical protein
MAVVYVRVRVVCSIYRAPHRLIGLCGVAVQKKAPRCDAARNRLSKTSFQAYCCPTGALTALPIGLALYPEISARHPLPGQRCAVSGQPTCTRSHNGHTSTLCSSCAALLPACRPHHLLPAACTMPVTITFCDSLMASLPISHSDLAMSSHHRGGITAGA